ncbi:terminase small subunit [Kistimonas asteriae]|uniref:terminase small subunit n=1 Tax=Kistimonas asteriae TaxID=517724 RepID=UPI001BAC5B36|nr:terminase small subunit [Kistimonas asteriae]
MNSKHQRFIDEYLIDQNATRAAIAAGYSEHSARSQGSRLLTNADIQKAIHLKQAQLSSELNITALAKRQKLWEIASFCSEQISGTDGLIVMRNPRAATAAIAELNKMDGEYRQTGSDAAPVVFIQEFSSSPEGLDSTILPVSAQFDDSDFYPPTPRG